MKKPTTKLAVWMKSNRWNDKLFADEVSSRSPNTVSAHTVFNWRHGISIPRKSSMRAIEEITAGIVTPNDFILVEQQG